MKLGAWVSVLLGGVAACVMVTAFLTQSSPYVTVAQAKSARGDNLHVVGNIDKKTLVTRARERLIEFTLVDEHKQSIPVVYQGPQPANLGQATQVVVIGGMKDGAFHARDMLVKCPSKYEGTAEEHPANIPMKTAAATRS